MSEGEKQMKNEEKEHDEGEDDHGVEEEEDDDGEQDYGQDDYDDPYYEHQCSEQAEEDEHDIEEESYVVSAGPTEQQNKENDNFQYYSIEYWQLTAIVRKMIKHTMDDKGVSSGQALLLISMLNYNNTKIHNPKQEVFDSIFAHQDTPEQLIKAASYREECLVCNSEKDLECHPSCKHYFCQDCLRKYLQESINSGKPDNIGKRCPQEGCKEILDLELIERVIDKATLLRFEKLLADDYSSKTGTTKCLNRSCDLYFKINKIADSSQPLDLFCTCGYSQCSQCNLEAHSPLTCKSFEKLFKIIMGIDNILDYWNLPNTKACPLCKALIENQQQKPCKATVKCQCKYEMCWYCLEKPHFGTTFMCKQQWKEGEENQINVPKRLQNADLQQDSIAVLYLKFHQSLQLLLQNRELFEKEVYVVAGNGDAKSIENSLTQHNFTNQLFKFFIEYSSFAVFASFLLKTNDTKKTDFQQFQVDELKTKLISHQELVETYLGAVKVHDLNRQEDLKDQIAKSSVVIAKMKTVIGKDITKEFNEAFMESELIGKEKGPQVPYQVERDDEFIDVDKIYKEQLEQIERYNQMIKLGIDIGDQQFIEGFNRIGTKNDQIDQGYRQSNQGFNMISQGLNINEQLQYGDHHHQGFSRNAHQGYKLKEEKQIYGSNPKDTWKLQDDIRQNEQQNNRGDVEDEDEQEEEKNNNNKGRIIYSQQQQQQYQQQYQQQQQQQEEEEEEEQQQPLQYGQLSKDLQFDEFLRQQQLERGKQNQQAQSQQKNQADHVHDHDDTDEDEL